MTSFQTTEMAAKAVGLSRWFLYRNAKNNPAARRAGKALRWDLDRLKDWMAENAGNANGGSKEEEHDH